MREHPITPYTEIARRGLGAISRSYLSKDKTRLYAAVRYAGRVPHLVSIDVATGAVTELAEIEGAVSYRVSSLAYDPQGEKLFYTTDNLTYRNLNEYDLKTGTTRELFAARAHRRPRLQPGGPFALGPAHQQRLRDGRAHSVSLQGMADAARLSVR